jgi:hypothetical protein
VSEGFYKRRRGILEHIEAGTIDLLESGIHDYLSLKANLLIGSACSIPVGFVYTSAPAIHAHCKRVSERTIQRILEHMEAIGWLKTFRTSNQRGNYLTLICRASVHDLSGNEYRINADATTDWRYPVYEPVGEVSPETANVVGKVAGYRELREESGEKREHQQTPARVPPADSLELETKEAAFDVFWEQWPKKQQRGSALRSWLKIPMGEYPAITSGLEKWRTSDQWTRGVIPHAATWLTGKRWEDQDVPQFSAKGTSNGKPTATDLAIRNARTLGLDRPN